MAASTLPQPDLEVANPGEQSQKDNPYGQNNEKLPEALQTAIKSLVTHFQQQEKWARRQEVIDARRQRFYESGSQYVYWNSTAWMFATASSAAVSGDTTATDMPRYTDVYNIYRPYEKVITAVLNQNPPGVTFEPDDFFSADDIMTAKAAEKYRQVIDRANDRKRLQSEIARLFWTDGRVVTLTHTVADAQKWGTDKDGNPKQNELIEAFGVLESKVPITAKELSEWPFCVLSKEVDVWAAKKEFPDAAAKIKEGSTAVGESAYERMARIGVLQGGKATLNAGDAFAHLVTKYRCWLRPACYLKADEASRAQLDELFPDGLFVTFVGDAYCSALNQSMDDCLAVAHPLPGDGQNRPSLGKDLVPIQDAFNDYKNLEKEIFDYCIPSTWMDESLGDVQALREQISEPGNHVSAKRPNNMSMSDAFFVEPPAACPPSMVKAYQDLQGQLAQFVTGAFPSVFGGDMKDQDTATAYAMAREQAMGQIGLPWGAMQELYAKIYKQAVLAAVKNRPTDAMLSVSSDNNAGPEQIAIADLQKGNFHCFPDADSSFPETLGAKKQAWQMLLTELAQNPMGMEILMQPDNLELGKELLGLPELTIPGAEARDKQLREIEQLLREQPIPPSPEEMQQAEQAHAMASEASAMTGQPPPAVPDEESLLKTSVPVDPEFDFHNYEFEEVQRWLSSEERAQEQAKGNLAGIENVRLHGLQHKQFMAPPEMPMAPPAKPPAPSQPKPAPAQPGLQ